MKRLLLLVRVLLCVMFFVICGSAIRAHAEVIEVPIEVTFCQDRAREMFQYVNDFRTGNEAWYWNEDDTQKVWADNLQPLKYDYNLEKVAMQRAVEVALYMDIFHQRADGEKWSQTYSDLNYKRGWAGENVTSSNSISYYNSFQAVEGLKEENFGYSGQGHRRNMLDSKWIVCGFGCVTYNGEIYYVQEFASENESISYIYTEPDLSTRICYSKATYDEDNPLYIDPIVLYKGDTIDLSAVSVCRSYIDIWDEKLVKEIAVTPSFSVGDSSIAKISGNNLTALKAGSTQITAKFDIKGKQYTIKTSVSVISFSIDKENAEMKPNETLQLNAKIEGVKDNKDLKINWSSSNDSVASVNSKGLVTAKKTGSAKITAQIADSNKAVSCWIDVKIPIEGISLSENSITCKKGDSITLSVLRNPRNASENEPVTWTIKNEKGEVIAEKIKKTSGYSSRKSGSGAIEFESYGFDSASFSAIESGKATIIVTIGDKSAECSVTVKSDSGNNQSSKTQEELVRDFVKRFYTIILQRKQVNDEEIEYYTSRLMSHEIDGCSVAKGFVLSPEYVNKHENDLDFVKKMYAAFFNREADAAQYYCDILASGQSREVVLAGFVNSPEFKQLCADYGINPGELIIEPQNNNQGNQGNQGSGDITKLNLDSSNVDPDKLDAYVKGLYQQILGRGYDDGGLQYWKEQIMAGTTYDAATAARVGFFESPEYQGKNKSNQDFVIDCYHAFLGREPEPDGLTYWTDKLNSGEYSKQKVIDLGFGHSEEFKNILRGCGFRIIE